MAGRIPRDFIDDLIARTDIVELVDSRVRLKKAGRNYQACCPFHNEKTPSFTVSQEKQFYHCFGCGAHGNAISFLLEYDRLEFPEAVEELARFHGLDVPREQGSSYNGPSKQERENDYQLMQQAAAFFAQQLKSHPNASKAVAYLKQRGLSGEIAKAFDMGYAPDSWDALFSALGKTPERQSQMLELKLLNENDKKRRYDFFRDRIMFPIRDKRGRVIGFGGRVLGDGTPKYLNSPETRIFHKGQELYGFYQARQANRQLARVLIVEGYMDVVALAQFGISYAVASLGTATTAEQLSMLYRATPEVICCYDGDRAGRDAAWRAMQNALPYLKDGVQMRFLFLPDGEDPDSMVRKVGKEAFEQQLEAKSLPLSRYLFDTLLQQHNIGSFEGKAALKAAALPLIDKVAGEHQRSLLQGELSRLLGEQDKHQLAQDIARANQAVSRRQQSQPKQPERAQMSPVRMLLRLLLSEPALAGKVPQVQPAQLSQSPPLGLDLLIEVHQFCLANPDAHTGLVLEHFRQHPQARHLTRLLGQEHIEQNTSQVYKDSFAKLLQWQLNSRKEQLLAKSRVNPLSHEEKQELTLLLARG